MKRQHLSAFLLIAALAGALFFERRMTADLKAQNQSWRTQKEEVERLRAENLELMKYRQSVAGSAPEEWRGELLRLRSEAGRLRSQKLPAVESLRAENERIAAELASGQIKPRRLADTPEFVAREKWTRAGFATPEAALESFMWAMNNADVNYLLQCVTPSSAKGMESQIKSDPANFQKAMFDDTNPFRKINGFLIKERQDVRSDKVQLGIQVAADGAVLLMTVRLLNGEWKLDMP